MNKSINIIFPNQLFEKSFVLDNDYTTYLMEEYLFFKQFNFHKQKIAYHRSSMKKYYDFLTSKGKNVKYIDSYSKTSDLSYFLENLDDNIKELNIYNPVDNWLLKKFKKTKCTIASS